MRKLLLTTVLLSLIAGPGYADVEQSLRLIEDGKYVAALKQLKPEAEDGDADAQFLIGYIYLNGLIAEPTPNTALKFLKASAEQDQLQAQMTLAQMYRDGNQIEAKPNEALRWYRRAALQGDVGAQLMVADMYAFGNGVAHDPIEAYAWYTIGMRYWGNLAVRARNVVARQLNTSQLQQANKRAESMPVLMRE